MKFFCKCFRLSMIQHRLSQLNHPLLSVWIYHKRHLGDIKGQTNTYNIVYYFELVTSMNYKTTIPIHTDKT